MSARRGVVVVIDPGCTLRGGGDHVTHQTRLTRRALLYGVAGIATTVALSACTAPAPSAPPAAPASTAAPVSAAAKPTEPAAPRRGGTLVVGLEAEPGTLDNSVGTGYHTSIIQRMVFESLVGYDLTSNADTLPIKPILAESWQISTDGKVYTFKLRTGVDR